MYVGSCCVMDCTSAPFLPFVLDQTRYLGSSLSLALRGYYYIVIPLDGGVGGPYAPKILALPKLG